MTGWIISMKLINKVQKSAACMNENDLGWKPDQYDDKRLKNEMTFHLWKT